MERTQPPQVFFVPGGESFQTRDAFLAAVKSWELDLDAAPKKRWRDALRETVEDAGGQFHFLAMPCRENANYAAWKIWFEKAVPHMRNGVTLIGHSLGGSFLLRYLSEETLPVTVRDLHLVAPAVTEAGCPGLGEFATDLDNWSGLCTVPATIHLYHSADDTVVPVSESEALRAVLPQCAFHRFLDRGHFSGAEFPELKV